MDDLVLRRDKYDKEDINIMDIKESKSQMNNS